MHHRDIAILEKPDKLVQIFNFPFVFAHETIAHRFLERRIIGIDTFEFDNFVVGIHCGAVFGGNKTAITEPEIRIH
jgi:hypothetical protein